MMPGTKSSDPSGSRSRTVAGLLLLVICLALGISEVSSNGGNNPSSTSSVKPTGNSQPQRSTSTSNSSQANPPDYSNLNDLCPNNEPWCSLLDETEKLALEAVRALFRQLDDDKDGNIDLEESNEFLREELKYEKNIENRQKAFHRDDDTQISVRELWETWVRSEVHNWTTVQTVDWLKTFVTLPQHQERFLASGINGTVLPILAVNHNNFLTTVIGIKDTITKQKIAVKAMDVVLFGPPRDNTNYIKDTILTTALALAIFICLVVYNRYKLSQENLADMTRHMAELSKAEELLLNLQKDLEKAKEESRSKNRILDKESFDGEGPEELEKLREENLVLRSELHRAETELQDKCWIAPHALQHWLQYTYELELKTYNKKKTSAERQLKQAKEACDKLKKKRSSLMGAFVSTHGRSIDDVDKAILEARTALTEITYELQERMHRWKQMELLVGFQIMNNSGLQHLDNLLKGYGKPALYSTGPGSVISNSQDDIDDDGASSIYCPSTVHKLVNQSTYLMLLDGHQVPFPFSPPSSRLLNPQQSPTTPSGYINMSGLGNNRSHEASVKEKITGQPVQNGISTPIHSCASISDMSECPVSTVQISSNATASMSRSKSVTSMISLRDRNMSREASSKDSSNGEEDVLAEGLDSANARDRRVTFRADRRAQFILMSNGRATGSSFESMDSEESRRAVTKALKSSDSVEIPPPRFNTEEREETQEAQATDPMISDRDSINDSVTLPTSLTSGSTDDTNTTSLSSNHVTITSPSKKVWGYISNLVRNGDKKGKQPENENAKNPIIKTAKNGPLLKNRFKGFFQRSVRAKIHPMQSGQGPQEEGRIF